MDVVGNLGPAGKAFLDFLEDAAPQSSNFKRRARAALSSQLAFHNADHISLFNKMLHSGSDLIIAVPPHAA